jgi:hypothetical protein
MTDGFAATRFTVRRGGVADLPLLIALFDDAIAWLVERGLTAQWGSTPFSEIPDRVESMRTRVLAGDLRVCELRGEPVAAIILGEAMPYVPPTTCPELYVQVLIGSPGRTDARGAGALLLRVAEEAARAKGVERLRVDCFAGNDGDLVRFYERAGFTRLDTFMVRDWPGQVLERRLA